MAIDYDLIFSLAKERGWLTSKQLTEAQEDDMYFSDLVSEESKTMLVLAWDGDGPGHSGAVSLQEWKGLYFVDDEVEGAGPFTKLDEALGCPEFHFSGTPKPELSSDSIPNELLLQLAGDLARDEGKVVIVNGCRYKCDGSKLVAG